MRQLRTDLTYESYHDTHLGLNLFRLSTAYFFLLGFLLKAASFFYARRRVHGGCFVSLSCHRCYANLILGNFLLAYGSHHAMGRLVTPTSAAEIPPILCK